MKITLEFSDAERFMKELPQFANVIGFAAKFVQFSRVDKNTRDIEIQADIPEIRDGKIAKTDANRIYDAAKAVGAYTPRNEALGKASESPEDAPEESDGSSEKGPENEKLVDSPQVEPDIADVRKVLHAVIKAGHKDEMKALLSKLGAQNVSTLDPAKYAEFITEANKIGGGDNA